MLIEIIYATPNTQNLQHIEIEDDSTVQQAIEQSGLLLEFPELDLMQLRVGVFGKFVALTDVLKESDRVEIYRPLIIGPIEARHLRAAKKTS
jgi:putative ubiquitin-RnfH superfamily antitoxin RatB of RatAB toxin-antitoxin module